MKLDVLADLDHLFMLNFSAPAAALRALVPAPLRLLVRHGRGFPSIVLPSIRRLRPARLGVPRVNYELFGLRILVEYDSQRLGPTKGIYFARLIMDPPWVRLAANTLTSFRFEPGTVTRRGENGTGKTAIEVRAASGQVVLAATVARTGAFPRRLTPGSCFRTPAEALGLYNDIAHGFLAEPGGAAVHILQIAAPHPNYVAWPLRHLTVDTQTLTVPPQLAGLGLQLEPCYYVGPMRRYWRWLRSEPAPRLTAAGTEGVAA